LVGGSEAAILTVFELLCEIMMDKKECPNCGYLETERVHTEWYSDLVEETRICSDCDTQFTNSYDLFEQAVDDVPAL
jgi:RNA polymerase subunit RPABC4/transcription elongation factor Spt4